MTDLLIGIDTGVNTGFAVYSPKEKRLKSVETLAIHDAILKLMELHSTHRIKVRIEDARLRKWVLGGREKLQGIGSVKRDAKILEDMCKDKGIPYEMVAPKNNKTNLTAAYFTKLTGWVGRTSTHARDGAMLVFGL
jgi:hypothetical protein